MSGVLRRTVYYEFDQRPEYKCFRFSDWNVVITSLGAMMEPSFMVPYPSNAMDLDWNDSMTKIDQLKNWGSDSPAGLNGSSDIVTGYNLVPRKGR